MKKPIKHGNDMVRTDARAVRKFTKDGAQRYADRVAKRSPVPNCVGEVLDCGHHFEVRVVFAREKERA